MNLEATVISILKRSVELDNNKQYTGALVCYQEGIQMLMDFMKTQTGERRDYFRQKVEDYMTRAEKVKSIISQLKDEGKYHEQINIENNSTGHSYETVFKKFLDFEINSVKIEDPYIRSFHQCQNLVMFCELLVKHCSNLKMILLITTQNQNSEQQKWLKELKDNLINYKTDLKITYSTTLHDRQISLSNGWIIKIGRGLDYFQKSDGKFSLGNFDYNLRKCHETTIDIFHQKNVKSFG